MRGFVLALMLLAPLAAGQAIEEDGTGDVVWELTTGDEVPAPQDQPAVDFESIWVGAETATTLELGIDMVAPRPQQDPLFAGTIIDRVVLAAGFTVGDQPYRLDFTSCRSDQAMADLSRGRADGLGFAHVGCLDVSEEADGTYRIVVPKAWLQDENHIPVGMDVPLTGLHGTSRAYPGGGYAIARDRVPDAGVVQDVAMQIDDAAFGPFRIATPSPVRASNGGPDTIVYALRITNSGPADDLLLHVTDLPPNWSARVAGRVHVGGHALVPLVVAIPGAHAHGTTQQFTLEAQSASDPDAIGRPTFGVQFLAVPQLAGHHPMLYVHTRVDDDRTPMDIPDDAAWFNTQPEDSGSDQEPLPPMGGGGGTSGARYLWDVPLDPELLIGLDFDMEDVGAFRASFTAQAPHPGAAMTAQLWHCVPGDGNGTSLNGWPCSGSWYLLASGTSDPQDIDAGGRHVFEAVLTPDPYADLVPYVDGSNIQLSVRLDTTGAMLVEPASVRLDPSDALLELPLFDYNDPVDEGLQAIGKVGLRALGDLTRRANAGQTLWFEFDVTNADAGKRNLRFDLAGHNAAWASWRSVPKSLPAETDAQAALAIDIPRDARPGEFAEVLVVMEDADNAAVSAVAKILATVVAEPQPDDSTPSFVDGKGRKSPGLPSVATVIGLAVVGLLGGARRP